jgi:hypothetical protein
MTGGGGRHRAPRLRAHPRPIPVASILADTPLWVADSAGSKVLAGHAERGALVRLGERRGDLVELRFDSGYVNAPAGKTFLVAASAVSEPRDEDRNVVWRPLPLPVLDETIAP